MYGLITALLRRRTLDRKGWYRRLLADRRVAPTA
jgi:hypothetical protein